MDVLVYPHELLMTVSQPVGVPSKADLALADAMAMTMFSMSGVGLAAPQVGVNKRLIVVDLFGFGQHTAMFDPVITKLSDETVLELEGCLSIPGVVLPVKRAKSIIVSFVGTDKKNHVVDLVGYASRVVQHEVDHLNGITMIDRSRRDIETGT